MGAVAYGSAEKVSESSGSPATREVTSDIGLREFSRAADRQTGGRCEYDSTTANGPPAARQTMSASLVRRAVVTDTDSRMDKANEPMPSALQQAHAQVSLGPLGRCRSRMREGTTN